MPAHALIGPVPTVAPSSPLDVTIQAFYDDICNLHVVWPPLSLEPTSQG
jgi:hypothetical protein